MNKVLPIVFVLIAIISCKKDYYGPIPDDWSPPYARLTASALVADSTTWFQSYG